MKVGIMVMALLVLILSGCSSDNQEDIKKYALACGEIIQDGEREAAIAGASGDFDRIRDLSQDGYDNLRIIDPPQPLERYHNARLESMRVSIDEVIPAMKAAALDGEISQEEMEGLEEIVAEEALAILDAVSNLDKNTQFILYDSGCMLETTWQYLNRTE